MCTQRPKRCAYARPHSYCCGAGTSVTSGLSLGLMRTTNSLTGASLRFMMHDIRPHIICLSGVQHTRLLAGALKGEGALDDVGDLVGIGMNMPRQNDANRKGVALRVDLFARIAGKLLHEELLRFDLARAFRLAGEHDAGGRRREHPHPRYITSSRSSAHAFFGL